MYYRGAAAAILVYDITNKVITYFIIIFSLFKIILKSYLFKLSNSRPHLIP